MLSWAQTEFLLKGLYLGFLVMIAWLEPTWEDLGKIGAFTVAGFALFLGIAGWQKIREGYRVGGRWLGFLLFLVLENPGAVYCGILGGLAVGASATLKDHIDPIQPDYSSLLALLGGAVFGMVLYGLRHVRQSRMRMWLGLALAVVLVGSLIAVWTWNSELFDSRRITMIGWLLLLGIPGFYLLTFASLIEESEVEIAAICAAAGVALWILGGQWTISPAMRYLLPTLPLAIYYVYTQNMLPGLRVFKHALRGLSYREVGKLPLALISLRRALQLQPNHYLARETMFDIHRHLSVEQLQQQPELLGLVDFNLCLERVQSLLLRDRPTTEHLAESMKLLDMIQAQQPITAACCQYWRAVALVHRKSFDEAADQLSQVCTPPSQESPYRDVVHFPAWQLALALHPEMIRRVGTPMLQTPSHRLDAIAAVEKQLGQIPNDPAAWELKRVLYADLRENDMGDTPPARFDYAYAEQLGQALIEDRQRWTRGCEFLRIAARGQPARAAELYIQIAVTHEKHGDQAGLWANYRQAMQVGRNLGVQNMTPDQRKNLFAVVKKIGENAMSQNQNETALEALKFYSQSDEAGIETWRTLAELFERQGDVFQAASCTEFALSFNEKDADLLTRKDKYYFSMQPADLQRRVETVKKWLDTQYCVTKSKNLLEKYNGDLELLEWSHHLAQLANIAKPDVLAAKFVLARIHRLRGELPECIALLEEIRQNRPSRFAGEDESNAWYFGHRLLGDLYVDTKPDQAILCLQEFRQSSAAGADTQFKMGRAYENLGDLTRAASCYREVTAFESHPLYYEARDALERLRRGVSRV